VVRALLAAVPLLCGCVTAQYERERRHDPLPASALARLEPGASDLEHCLAALGAPLWVRAHGAGGLALAYGWQDARRWRLSVSAPVSRQMNASFRYERGRSGLYGHVLFLDGGWRLQRVVEGWLDAIVEPAPPAAVEEIEEGRT
jgi:hypothetical protein